MSQPSIQPTTIYLFRTGEKETSYNPQKPTNVNPNNSWITNPTASLTERGKQQAQELGQWFIEKGIRFDVVISANATATLETANAALPHHKINEITADWREVELGDLEGKNDAQVMALFAKYHPNGSQPYDGNECLNQPWQQIEGESSIKFEPYCDFKKRITKNIVDLDQKYKGKVIAIFTHYEPLRDAILFSSGTEHFFSTPFGTAISERLKQAQKPAESPLGSVIRRTMIKADKAAAVKLQMINGQFYVDDSFKIKLAQDEPKK